MTSTRSAPDRRPRTPRPPAAEPTPVSTAGLSREYGPNLFAAVLLVVGLGLWLTSLSNIPTTNLTDYGLAPELPATWYAGLEVLLVGAAVATCAPRSLPVLQGALVVAVVVVLFGTVPAIAGPPHYAWTYKHIGVVRHITATKGLDLNLDIYNRWPGFFSVGALMSSLFGIEDPTRYAAWAEVFFNIIDVFLVAAIARTLTRDARLSWTAALIFAIANWIGQDYYSPQAFDFVLVFGIYLIVLRYLPVREDLGKTPVVGAVLRRLKWAPDRLRIVNEAPGSSRRAAILAIAVLDVAAAISHQLSPYMLLLGLGTLVVFRVVRSWWLLIGLTLITVGFLAPNFTYVQQHFGLFSSGLSSSNETPLPNGKPMAGSAFQGTVAQLLTLAVWLLMLVGLIRRLRRRHAAAIPVALLAIAPLVTILVQSYGGEGFMRVYLFSLPWAAILIVWAVAPLDGWWRPGRAPLLLALFTVLAGLFVPAFYGQEELNLMPSDEVVAMNYFYDHIKGKTTLLGVGSNAPGQGSQHYSDVVNYTDVTIYPRLCGYTNERTLLRKLDAEFNWTPYPRYIMFTTTGTAWAVVLGNCSPEQVSTMEQNVARSGDYKMWYKSADVRVYERVGHR